MSGRQHHVLRHVPLSGAYLRRPFGRPRRYGRQPADVATGVPCAGSRAGPGTLRERAILVRRRSATIRADVRRVATQAPFGGLRPGFPDRQVRSDRGHPRCPNVDRPLPCRTRQRSARLRHPCADEGEAGCLNGPPLASSSTAARPRCPTASEQRAVWCPGIRFEPKPDARYDIWFRRRVQRPIPRIRHPRHLRPAPPPHPSIDIQLAPTDAGCLLTFADILWFDDKRTKTAFANAVLGGWHQFLDRWEIWLTEGRAALRLKEPDYSRIDVPGRP